ncbi:hypothetical protein EMGBD1_22390 [Anaerolineaceae bacterium]|nr:hypothetical protein EMGBD1_22390 [Anaerolineaceae bacterium]
MTGGANGLNLAFHAQAKILVALLLLGTSLPSHHFHFFSLGHLSLQSRPLRWRGMYLPADNFWRAAQQPLCYPWLSILWTRRYKPKYRRVYGVAVSWMIIWLLIYFDTQKTTGVKPWHWPIVFGASFMVAIWSEVFLISFFGVVAYLFYDAWRGDHKHQSTQRGNTWLLAAVVLAGYVLALLYYTSGGHPEVAIDRGGSPGRFTQILNPASIAHALLQGSKEIAILFKDCVPLFVVAGYIKLKNKAAFQSLEKHYKLFLALTAGIFAFMIICVWLAGVIHWRTRWPCALVLMCTFISIPETLWGPLIGYIGHWRWKSHLALISWWSALIWLAANAYFTYGYTNIDVRGWLQYRQMVVDRNPAALDRLCCHTLPAGRPRGTAWWDHEWGAQDDRYRFFMAPELIEVRGNVRFYWGN